MPYRSADYVKPGRGSRILVVSLTCVVGLMGAWVLAANTILKDGTQMRDVATALLAARDTGPPTLSTLKVASAQPDAMAIVAADPVPAPGGATPTVTDPTSADGGARTEDPPVVAAAEPAPMVLASAGSADYTGALAAAPLPAGMPDSAEEMSDEPLAGLVPMPRKRPPVSLIPLPRPRPEIEAVASAAPTMSLTPYEIDKHQPH
jgi:hypothetical protein